MGFTSLVGMDNLESAHWQSGEQLEEEGIYKQKLTFRRPAIDFV